MRLEFTLFSYFDCNDDSEAVWRPRADSMDDLVETDFNELDLLVVFFLDFSEDSSGMTVV